ncbi:hypothetical protein [Bacillus phage SDFMU_Pbc]|uniref:Uncharacterized protein n=1 Tax=Bacillus phage SDFMU_Pbc TaxID=3076135 RepID=A0AA96R2R0_9CAUD|nr:hypothetical protein [Bacillus phage SDFMU_Pbc]
MRINEQGDVIAGTLQSHRDRTSTYDVVPKPFKAIKSALEKTIKEGKRVLIDVKDSYSTQTVVVRFDAVFDRWAKGNSICHTEQGEVAVPYTIHYSDILCKNTKIKIITEGENPLGTQP